MVDMTGDLKSDVLLLLPDLIESNLTQAQITTRIATQLKCDRRTVLGYIDEYFEDNEYPVDPKTVEKNKKEAEKRLKQLFTACLKSGDLKTAFRTMMELHKQQGLTSNKSSSRRKPPAAARPSPEKGEGSDGDDEKEPVTMSLEELRMHVEGGESVSQETADALVGESS